MASVRLKETKEGKRFYEIRVNMGRGLSQLTKRWYIPECWSEKAIQRELAKVSAEFERQCKAGEIHTKKEQREYAEQKAREAAAVFTVERYGESVFMPTKAIQCSENTRSFYQAQLDNHIYGAVGGCRLSEVTPAQLNSLLLSMQKDGFSHSSLIAVYTTLHQLFKSAYLHDMVDRNPMDKVQRPRPTKDKLKTDEIEAYTAEELRYIRDCLDNEPLKWRAMVYLLIDSGIRRGEACGLQWSHVDFKNSCITIAANLCYTKDKGVYLDTPKSGKPRTIDIDPDVMELLKELRFEQSVHCISKFVFTQDNSSAPMHPQSPTRYFQKLSKRYGIDNLHPHKLRHSFASVAITNGADIASVSEKLGHADKAITLRMYTHADSESIKRAGDIFRAAVKNQKQA